jgi:hypothetical protein
LLQPGGFLPQKPRPRYFAGDPLTLIQLSETDPDLLVHGVPALVKQRFFVVEQLDGSFHKLFDASVSTARYVPLNQGLKLGLEMNGHERTVGGFRPVSIR